MLSRLCANTVLHVPTATLLYFSRRERCPLLHTVTLANLPVGDNVRKGRRSELPILVWNNGKGCKNVEVTFRSTSDLKRQSWLRILFPTNIDFLPVFVVPFNTRIPKPNAKLQAICSSYIPSSYFIIVIHNSPRAHTSTSVGWLFVIPPNHQAAPYRKIEAPPSTWKLKPESYKI